MREINPYSEDSLWHWFDQRVEEYYLSSQFYEEHIETVKTIENLLSIEDGEFHAFSTYADPLYSNENYSYPTGFYSEDFSDNLSQGGRVAGPSLQAQAITAMSTGKASPFNMMAMVATAAMITPTLTDNSKFDASVVASNYYETRIESPFSLAGLS